MDFSQLYHFLFETYGGMGVLFAATIVICLIACVIMEFRTRKVYTNHEKTEDDWSFFDEDDEEASDVEKEAAEKA